MQKIKICSKCGRELSVNMFGKHKGTKDGLQYSCKECINLYYKENRDKRIEYSKLYHNENKDKVVEYRNQYRQKNKDKISEHMKWYYEENKDKLLEDSKQFNRENKDKVVEYRKHYYKENKNKLIEKCRKWRVENKEYYEKNKNKISCQVRQWQQNNIEKVRVIRQRRRSKKNLLTSTLTYDQWEQIKNHFKNRCSYCGKVLPLEQEHFIPLSKGGEYSKHNIIPACKSCNSSKNDRDFFEWYPKYKYYSKKREKDLLEFLGYDKENKQHFTLII